MFFEINPQINLHRKNMHNLIIFRWYFLKGIGKILKAVLFPKNKSY